MKRRALAGALLFAFPFHVAAGSRLLVFAAASLTDAVTEIGRAFTAKTGAPVDFAFGASSDLERQIEAGAPAEVFFSADTARMDSLEKARLVRHSDRREFLSNRLCVVVPARSTFQMKEPSDLLSLSRIALADPSAVPSGIYARGWLESVGLWGQIASHIVPTLDVRAALAAVEAEGVQAAIVYKTDAAISAKVRIVHETAGQTPILYSVAPLEKAGAAARQFVRFLEGQQARSIFERYGFIVRDEKRS